MTRIISFILAAITFLNIPAMFFTGTDRIITLKPAQGVHEFTGWGVSGAWWVQMFEDDALTEEIADALFDKEKGLGLTLYRYNIGAGEADNPNSRIGDSLRRVESFYVMNEETGEYEFDFTRDKNARHMLDLAIERGVTEVTLFSNSPHFSMTANGHASGSFKDLTCNLPRKNFQAYVDYMLTIADWFVEQGYPIKYISPINEPQWTWGGKWVGQEGCHYSAEEAVALYELFIKEMKARNTPYGLCGMDTGILSMDSIGWLDKYFESEIINEYCDTYSGHSYWRDNWIDEKYEYGAYFKEHYPDKRINMTEWCELPCKIDARSNESSRYQANIMIQDLKMLDVSSWQFWAGVNNISYSENGDMISDGLLRTNNEHTEVEKNKRYYAYKQFSSFIEPGMVRMDVEDIYVANGDISWHVSPVAFSGNGKTVVVFVNNLDSKVKVGFVDMGIKKSVYITDETRNCEKTYEGIRSTVDLPEKSIVTVVFE